MSAAWYENDRRSFLSEDLTVIVGKLASTAVQEGLHLEPEQREEWISSVDILQSQLLDRVEILREALASADFGDFEHVILEYDFRRRGLRLDCVLLGKGIIAVVEFKRSSFGGADRDQVSNYCINLVEFHEETRRACEKDHAIVVPVLALTAPRAGAQIMAAPVFHNSPWGSIVRNPIECEASNLGDGLRLALDVRRSDRRIDRNQWLASRFLPSSTIIDAAVSLYGQHDVSAILAHAAPKELIDECVREVAEWILLSKKDRKNRIIFVSGAPGAGKTLVGLKLVFDRRFRADAVFVTGNAPLVDVLSEALTGSYSSAAQAKTLVASGYSREDAQQVIRMATFKIVKAHAFLKERGNQLQSADGSIVVFDEAQRTYKEGREVLRRRLEENEADLILRSLEASYEPGAVVVALVGHNQAINRGEMGIAAWFHAARTRGWNYVISDKTLELSELSGPTSWGEKPDREHLKTGHLLQSLRYYRNEHIERWVDALLEDDHGHARTFAAQLEISGDRIAVVRDLSSAKAWARAQRVGEERVGIIASSQARRLAAEGLFVEHKPDIAKWMLAPSGDIRSSNMLETVQNQYQVQGLEIDYAIVCWDADLRREGGRWKSFKIRGSDWQRDAALQIAKNSYRVLLTRARKGMVVFVPRGDETGADQTREPSIYDAIVEYLLSCGATLNTG